MGCVGGCIGGPCSLTHKIRDKMDIDKYGKEMTIKSAINGYVDMDILEIK